MHKCVRARVYARIYAIIQPSRRTHMRINAFVRGCCMRTIHGVHEVEAMRDDRLVRWYQCRWSNMIPLDCRMD